MQKATGWHGWKWNMRLSQAVAELAFARGAWPDAVRAATQVVAESQARHRPKYEALGLATRAPTAHRMRARSAPKDARAAVEVARRLGDPAVLLDCLIAVLEIDGNDEQLDHARQTVRGIEQSLGDELRTAFLTSVRGRAPGILAP